MLQETITLLEIQSAKVDKKSVTVQTEIIRCEECEFPAEDVYEIVDHMHGSHPIEIESEFKCHYCGECFENKKCFMEHRKEAHIEKVKPCSYFIEGKCDFDDECWYVHCSTGSGHEKKEFICRVCDKRFTNKNDFMQHRTKEHVQNVFFCKNALKGTCRFGAKKCWFNHSDNEITYTSGNENENGENLQNMNQEMMEKLFEMMEKFTQRIIQIENNI